MSLCIQDVKPKTTASPGHQTAVCYEKVGLAKKGRADDIITKSGLTFLRQLANLFDSLMSWGKVVFGSVWNVRHEGTFLMHDILKLKKAFVRLWLSLPSSPVIFDCVGAPFVATTNERWSPP